jgi:hypothetical protein
MMQQQVIKRFVYGQVFFYLGLLAAVALQPAGLAANDGISYYGIYLKTVLPYTVGLLGTAYFTGLAGTTLRQKELLPIRWVLIASAPLLTIIALTPYSFGRVVEDTHTTAGAILFILQLLLSGWLIVKSRFAWWAICLSLSELACGIMSFIYLHPKDGLLLQMQVLFQLAFGILLILSLYKLLSTKRKHV